MDKKLYNLQIDEELEHAIPPLEEAELNQLVTNLLKDGCRDDIVVWNGFIVDGHNRYRICHEYEIPFSYVEKQFEDKAAAKLWIIENQLGRRNVPAFVKIEWVLPLEAELKAEAKKRQIRKPAESVLQNFAKQNEGFNTREELAGLAGVSGETIRKAKEIVKAGDEDTKKKLRSGELSIHKAYMDLKKDKSDEIIPGHTVGQILTPEMMDYQRPSDDVYDRPPLVTYGMMPADDVECRGRAEMAGVRSSLQSELKGHAGRVFDILRKMTAASRTEENIVTLRQIVTETNNQIMDWLDQMLEEEEQ